MDDGRDDLMDISIPDASPSEMPPPFDDDGTTSCPFDPRPYGNAGMFHCPKCGAMVLGNCPHPTDAACRWMMGSEWTVTE